LLTPGDLCQVYGFILLPSDLGSLTSGGLGPLSNQLVGSVTLFAWIAPAPRWLCRRLLQIIDDLLEKRRVVVREAHNQIAPVVHGSAVTLAAGTFGREVAASMVVIKVGVSGVQGLPAYRTKAALEFQQLTSPLCGGRYVPEAGEVLIATLTRIYGPRFGLPFFTLRC
jgi:hypothetical protein